MQNRVLQIIWLALFMSIVIYGVIAFVAVRPVPMVRPPAMQDPFVLVIAAVAVVDLFLGFLWPRLTLGSFRRTLAPGTSLPPERIRVTFIVRWALFEAVAIFGLVLSFVRGEPKLFLPFAFVALAAYVLTFPSEGAVESLARQ